MLSKKMLSIIIPTWNSERDIANCLESIAVQKNKDFFNVIIQDNASTDNTLQIVDTFSKEIDISVESVKDGGVYQGMNLGLKRTDAKYVYFLGTDDKLHDDQVISDVEKKLASEDIDFLYGDVIFKNRNKVYGGKTDLEGLNFRQNICHQAIFYKRDLFDRMGLYNCKYRAWGDWEFNIRCFRNIDLNIVYFERLIAIYSDGTGVSQHGDPVFARELPGTYRNTKLWLYRTRVEKLLAKLGLG
jgi:glycosyltransferase involved in cell wall biosynthesis